MSENLDFASSMHAGALDAGRPRAVPCRRGMHPSPWLSWLFPQHDLSAAWAAGCTWVPQAGWGGAST